MNKNTYEGIHYFIELAKLGSITLVTKSLNVDHKTIKQKVQLLEKSLNVKLIDSSHKGTKLTNEGWDFYQKISTEYSLFNERVNNYINKIDIQAKSTINLLLPPASGLFFSLHILPELYKKHPEINVHITTFDVSYINDYGSHIRTLLNKYNFIMIDDASMHLINQDEWLLAFRQVEKQQLYANPKYMDDLNISNINDLHKANLISRSGTFEESGMIKLVNGKDQSDVNIQFQNSFSAKNDLIKAHLTDQCLGVTFISKTILNCGQHINLVNIFPEYTCKSTYTYSVLYKSDDIHKKYVKSITEIAKSVIADLGLL